jgi:hypothetical protein
MIGCESLVNSDAQAVTLLNLNQQIMIALQSQVQPSNVLLTECDGMNELTLLTRVAFHVGQTAVVRQLHCKAMLRTRIVL